MIRAGRDTSQVEEFIEKSRETYDVRHVSYVSSFRNAKAGPKPSVVVTYPQGWIMRYVMKGYELIALDATDGTNDFNRLG
jgi:Autoinducer binding domain